MLMHNNFHWDDVQEAQAKRPRLWQSLLSAYGTALASKVLLRYDMCELCMTLGIIENY